KEHEDFFSLEELEEMAADARISPEALRAAIDRHRRDAGPAAAPDGPSTGPLGRLEARMPASWSPGLKSAVLASVGVVALTALLLSFWVVAPALFWTTSLSLIVVSLLILLGASPF